MTGKYNKIILLLFALIAGIVWQHTSYHTVALSFLLILFFASKMYKKYFYSLALVALFSIGAIHHSLQYIKQKQFYDRVAGKTFSIVGIVKNIRNQESRRHKQCITIDTYKHKTLQIYTREQPNIQVGDTIAVNNLTCKKPIKQSFANYLIKEHIAANIFTDKMNYNVIKRPSFSFSRWIFNKREHLLEAVKTKMGSRPFAMFSSMFLGNKKIKKKENDRVKKRFKLWGILHFLARSGLHLIVFLIICELLLKCIPIHIIIKRLIILLIGIVYLLLSWPSISFIRAFSVFILYKTSPLLNKKQDLVYLITVVCFLMLIYNPMQLFFLDFQLSFGLTFALAILTRQNSKKPAQNNAEKK